MATSSIHIQKSVEGAVGHNSREHFSYSVVFIDDEKNECSNSQEKAYKIYRSELEKRAEKYTARTGQKMQKSTVTQLSSIINLEQHHTLKDLEPIKKHLEKIFDTKVYQMAVHRDEGKLISKIDGTELYSGKDFYLNTKDNELYFDKKFTQKIDLKDYEIVKNYHAHIEMMGLDSDGNAIRQKMNKVALQQLQTFVANELQMERGKENISYSKEEMKAILEKVGKKSDYESTTLYAQKFNETAKELGIFKEKYKRKDTHIFKDTGSDRETAKREAFKEVLATKKQLQEANNKLRGFIKENGGLRPDFAPVEAEKKLLEEKLKAKELTEKELLEKFEELEENFKKEKNHLISIIEVKDIDLLDVNNQNKSLEAQKEVLEEKVTTLESKSLLSASKVPENIKEEFEKIRKDEIIEKEVKTGLLKTEKIAILENPESFIKKSWNLFTSKINDLAIKYNQLVDKYESLKKENVILKEKVNQLSLINSEKKGHDYLEKAIQTMERTTLESDSSSLNKQESSVIPKNLNKFLEAQELKKASAIKRTGRDR